MVEELPYVLDADLRGGLKLALFLTRDQVARAIDDRQAWDSLIEGYLKAIRQVGITFSITNVDVDYVITVHNQSRKFISTHRSIEYVAVVAPIGAKDDQHSFVVHPSRREGHLKVFVSLFCFGIKVGVGHIRLG